MKNLKDTLEVLTELLKIVALIVLIVILISVLMGMHRFYHSEFVRTFMENYCTKMLNEIQVR